MRRMRTLTPATLLLALVIFSASLSGQTFQKKNLQIESQNLEEHFEKYSITQISKDYLKSSSSHLESIQLSLDENNRATLILHPVNLLASEYQISFPKGSEEELMEQHLAKAYSGFVKGDPSSTLRITIQDDAIYGFISTGKKKYFIEPAKRFDKSLGKDLMIVYLEEAVKKGQPIVCASTQVNHQFSKTNKELKMSGTCQVAQLAIAVDYAYRQDYGGSAGAINQTIAVMNMVAGVYENAFTDDIRFEIVEHFVSNCTTCDPWTNSTFASTLLSDFTSWGPTGFTETHDIGQLWTERNICGDDGNCSVAGLAWINAVCGNSRYHILEDFTSTAWQLRVLVSHEMGHNFGSGHDASGSQDIMAPSITTNTTSWSAQSVNSINTSISGFTCFDDCVIGACSEILSASTNNCIPGANGTYDLTIEVRHGGGGASAGFSVEVNGISFNQSWSSSPQTIVIPGLIADGTEDNSVTIAAYDGSDTGCAGTILYNEPPSDCTMRVVENFNNCTIPTGWSAASTNIYTWNGGDPLVQYQWKFDDASRQIANYNNGANASSLLTIDGSCMALMDDDIINHSLYTGDVTLTSDTYDVSDFDTLKLEFDYNFHPFEDGKTNNINSSNFKVEVYTGQSWVNILTDDDSSCSWDNVWQPSCITQVDMDVSAFINSSFAIRYIYSDGNNGKWTGMVALDNIEIRGTVEGTGTVPPNCTDGIQNGDETGIDCGGSVCDPCPSECEPIVTVTEGESGLGHFTARDLIQTSGTIVIDQMTIFEADESNIYSTFEVVSGTEFTIYSEGCED